MTAFVDSRGVLCYISEWTGAFLIAGVFSASFLIAGVFSAIYPSDGVF